MRTKKTTKNQKIKKTGYCRICSSDCRYCTIARENAHHICYGEGQADPMDNEAGLAETD